ncbi:hypothetical protein BZL30_9307 [Mycobacterium kansasii]|uniref:Uncharacterized protein n=1 Tax=Mycobacterium kansasii TaxID=1768 RepID=A0A1V3WB04_MYCKA|nr:hypothetical protein BZL30_9307 [Mycobacterium kansasii]
MEGSVAAVKPGVGQSAYSLGPTMVTLLATTFYTARAQDRFAGTGVSPTQAARALEATRSYGGGNLGGVAVLDPESARSLMATTQEIVVSALRTTSLLMALMPLTAAAAVWLLLPRQLPLEQRAG